MHVVESDARLVARGSAGDDDAWRELVERFSRYVYAVCGEIRTMPGLSSHPAAERIDIDADGNIVGLS